MTQTTEGTGPGSVAEIRRRIQNSLVREENLFPELLIPVGSVVPYISTKAPRGWLSCNGQEVSREEYSNLFSIIGTTYGVGDTETTFNLPNLVGRVIVGYGSEDGLTSRSMGDTGGDESHTLSIDEIPSHSHTVSNTVQKTGNDTPGSLDDTGNEIDNVDTSTTNTSSIGGGQSHNNMQPFTVLNYIIKY
jgi:microcystin-dependent protein